MIRLAWRLTALAIVLNAAPAAAQRVIVSEKLEDLAARAVKDSNDPAAHYNLAMGYWSKKRYADAERSLNTAVQVDPQFADAYLALSIVRNWDDDYWKQLRKEQGDSGVRNHWRRTNSYYRKAFLLDPMIDIKILGGTYRVYRGSYLNRFASAFADLFEGKYEKAFVTLDKEVEFWGGRAGADSAPEIVLWLHGLSAARTNRYEIAIKDMERMVGRVKQAAAEDSTDDVPLAANEFRYMMAALHHKAGHADQAIELFRQVAENDLGHYMAHVQLGRIYEAAKDYPRAVQARMNAVNANPDDSSLLVDLAVTLGKAGMMPQAETRLQTAAEANPRDARAFFWLGLAQMDQGKKEAARVSFTRFLELAPSRFDRQITMARERLAQLQ
jgi:tetratricopeptide (TPR) repeat protein